jgi:DNA repair ATPase RecN
LVRFEFIRVFSIKSATKHFYLPELIQQHPVSNKRIRDMKQIFIELIRQFDQIRLINSKVKLMLHNNYINIENLSTFNISRGFILYEKISNK